MLFSGSLEPQASGEEAHQYRPNVAAERATCILSANGTGNFRMAGIEMNCSEQGGRFGKGSRLCQVSPGAKTAGGRTKYQGRCFRGSRSDGRG